MADISITGIYQGKNLYVQNPFSSNGVGFCVYEVRVNGNVTTDETQSSAFEINLQAQNLKLQQPVTVVIYHKEGCSPKILNPEVLKPRSSFEVTAIKVVQKGADHFLQWETKNEQGKLNYIAEQYRWNKWVHFQETEGTGTKEPSHYETKVNLHSGQNRFRVMQLDYSGLQRVSKATEFVSAMPAVTFTVNGNTISFSAETMYEIYDPYGNIVKRGFGTQVDIQALAGGSYYVNYDNIMGQFVKG